MFVTNMKHKLKKLLIITLLVVNIKSYSQWVSYTDTNNAISTEINHQKEPRIVMDGKGGAIITWIDFRNDTNNVVGDIYAQRIKADGSIAWTNNGVAVCTNLADQTDAFIVEDGKGGAIISWQDIRTGNRDIYAQRIDSNGTALWTANGVAVVTKASEQRSPKIISDGAQGAIIAWEDSINGNNDIFIQRVLANGTLAWNSVSIPVCISAGTQMNVRLTTDGSNGAILTWQDKRNGNDYDIYAQRIKSNGTASWTTNGVVICNKVNTQNNPKIERDNNGGAYIMWADKRGAIDYDIYAQRINSAGAVQWVANGISVCSATGSQSALDATTDGVGNGIFIVWKDGRTINEHVFGQYLTSSGFNLFASDGMMLSNNALTQLNPNIVGVGNNEAVVTWQDSSSGNWDIYAQKMNLQTATAWGNSGVLISNALSNQTSPKNCSNGNGGSIFAFQDRRNIYFDIYASQIKRNGTFTNLVSSANQSSITLFPNPATTELFIRGKNNLINSTFVIITDMLGKPLLSERIIENKIDISKLENGIYLVSLYSENQELLSQQKLRKNE